MGQSKNKASYILSQLFILDQTLFMLSFLLKQLNSIFMVYPTELKLFKKFYNISKHAL